MVYIHTYVYIYNITLKQVQVLWWLPVRARIYTR